MNLLIVAPRTTCKNRRAQDSQEQKWPNICYKNSH